MDAFWLYLWCVLFSCCPHFIDGYLNVFISYKEVMKLMGLQADLYYIRDGVVNNYAMSFIVPVPATVYDLEFCWQSLTSYPLQYTIVVTYESQQNTFLAPELNIPKNGYIPQTVETFMVHLPCIGNASEEVHITISLYVQGPPNKNDTKLNFKRNKICLEGLFPTRTQSPVQAQAPSQRPLLLLAAACALGLLLVAGLIACAMYVRSRKEIRQDSMYTSFRTADYGSQQNVFIRLENLGGPPSVNSGSYATIASLKQFSIKESKKCWFQSTQTPSPYATALLPLGDQVVETVYTKPESVSYSHVTYCAPSQFTQYGFT